MIILGVHCGHDSCATIIKDGEILADVQEERFNRNKHSSDVPVNSIEYCLKAAGLDDINQVDRITVPWERLPAKLAALFGVSQGVSLRSMAKNMIGKIDIGVPEPMELKPPIYKRKFYLKDPSKIKCYNHHLCHAASAYFTSNSSEPCLIFTIDGSGDNVCTGIYYGEDNRIRKLESFYKEGALGWPYSLVTEAVGWIHGDGEGKLMGLAPYGDYSECEGLLDNYFPRFEGKKLVKPSKISTPGYWEEKAALQFQIDEADEVAELVDKYGKEAVAAEAQRVLEENTLNLVEGWLAEKPVKRIAFAGGVILNVKLNQKVWYAFKDRIDEHHCFPNPGDSGQAIGSALLSYYQDQEFKGSTIKSLYLGPEYSNEDIQKCLDIRKLAYRKVDDVAQEAATLLADNKIIAWFQGRMESGPRALGARSILMSPLLSDNKDIINANVKFREAFRPFCPSLIIEKRDDYLVDARDERFMITSFLVQDDKKEKIPAVVHVDGSVRPQMVDKTINPRYHALISRFGELTGEYILLNTSFNVMGEAIVNTPDEAIRCFYDSGIDALVIGDFIVQKPVNG